MAKYILSVMSKEIFKKDFESSHLVWILDKLGFGTIYRDAAAKDLLGNPYVFMDDNHIATLEKHTSLLDGLKHTAKDAHDCVSDSVHYTLENPCDVARIPYDVLKAVITSPKAIGIGILGLAVGTSGCTDKILGDDVNRSISDYLGDIVVDKEHNLTLGDSVESMHFRMSDVISSENNNNNLIQRTTPEGLVFYVFEESPLDTNGVRRHYDVNGDGLTDVRDLVVSKTEASELGVSLEKYLSINCISIALDLYKNNPELDEMRFRFHDLNHNSIYTEPSIDRLELIIDGKILVSLSDDLDNNYYLTSNDALIKYLNLI